MTHLKFKKFCHTLFHSLLSTILIFQIALPTNVNAADETNEISFDMADAQALDISATILTTLTVTAGGIVGAFASIQCRDIFKGSPSMFIYAIAAWMHLIAEIMNFIIYTKKGTQDVEAYKNEIKINDSPSDYIAQQSALVSARNINQSLFDFLQIKKWTLSIAGLSYTVAAAVAIIEAAKNKAESANPVTATMVQAQQVQTVMSLKSCHAKSEAEDKQLQAQQNVTNQGSSGDSTGINPEVEKIPLPQYYNSFLYFEKSLTGINREFEKRVDFKKLDHHSDVYQLAYVYTQWEKAYQNIVNHNEQFDLHREYKENIDIFKKIQSESKQFNILKNGIVALKQLQFFPEAMAQEATNQGYSVSAEGGWGAIRSWLVPLLGGALGLSVVGPIKKTIFQWLAADIPRAIYLTSLAFLSGTAAGLTWAEAEVVAKRIDQYNDILKELDKLQGGTSTSGSSLNTVGRIIDPALVGGGLSPGAICVDSSMQTDTSCGCALNNSCYSVKIPDSSYSGFQMPDFGLSSLESNSAYVNSLSSGNYGSASATAGSMSSNATRAMKKVEEQLDGLLTASGKKANSLSARNYLTNHIKANIKKGLGANANQTLSLGFSDLGWGNSTPTDPKKAVEEMSKVLIDIKKKEENPAADPLAGLDFGLSRKGSVGMNSQVGMKVNGAEVLDGLEVNYNDIHLDDRNIFDVLTNRYLQSYPKLMDEKK